MAILNGLAAILRDLVLIKVDPNRPELTSVAQELHPKLLEVSNGIELDSLLRWQAKLKGSENQLRQSAQPSLWLEVILLGILSKDNYNGSNLNKITKMPQEAGSSKASDKEIKIQSNLKISIGKPKLV